eukprot:gene12023-16038_t
MVIISGYENFVSRFDESRNVHWLGEIDVGSLKIKVASTIVAISSIHLLQVFLNVEQYSSDKLMWFTFIHLTFVVSALFLAFIDRDGQAQDPGDRMTLPTGVAARPVRFAQAAFFVLLALKLYFEFAAAPIGDEAYYWMWGQKLALSYFDHPPLHAWMLRVMNLVFGWNLFALRALTWFTFAGTLWIFWDWAKRLSPEDPQAWF